jgi:ATP-dependent DNA helicase RecG
MAPTEILAEQHFLNCQKLFNGKLNCSILTGRTPTSERSKLFQRLRLGEPLILIGTHAILEDPVIFKNLDLVIIDEQHRFGVEQRRTLRKKGVRIVDEKKEVSPHILVMTATPIPRTLALTAYGDLAVSTIREKPPGRSEVKTHVVRPSWTVRAYQKMHEELESGRQIYFIYPLVDESDAEGFTELKSAIQEAERIKKEFPKYNVGLLHGQMTSEDKERAMKEFKNGQVQILVSTTVIEVGVDVPNATIMCIFHSERFGLSQLHQLRGRVGRGKAQSYCFLFSDLQNAEGTKARLDIMEQTNDGFEIAEEDLRIRGSGEFLGTRQSGSLPFKMADLVRDRESLFEARDDCLEILKNDPDLLLDAHKGLRRFFNTEGAMMGERLSTS